jgi:hypothetical protein
MAPKSERLITEALGFPLNSVNLDFTDTTVSGVFEPNSTYRLAATEDCYVSLTDAGGDADADDMLIFAGIPETFVTLTNGVQLNVIRKTTNGELNVTRMVSRKE